ncbi:STAS domain-containing protein [Gordonia sp. X0973]|uniref:STAS domain-containing protein n=1 Tax=Gordonia sp. X0973 TaxID=2742602 RepID=UPI000F5441D1|nr:STAS domain-containing protein [Gordonia sp. X0973]QKT08329.1 STAS domain-containing protein [Gordonia sp. X0973]
MSDLISLPTRTSTASSTLRRDDACDTHVGSADGTTLVTVTGSIDATTVDEFAEHLDAAVASGGNRVVVDMTDVDFLGAGGMIALHGTALSLLNADGAIAVVGPRPVSRPLRRTGLDRVVPVFDWLPAAFEAVGGQSRLF